MHSKGKDSMRQLEREDAILDAADGMTTEEAVKYIKHGPEMVALIQAVSDSRNTIKACACRRAFEDAGDVLDRWATQNQAEAINLLAKLNKEGA